MTTYLFFDTETNGIPLDYGKPPSVGRNYPNILQLAWRCVSVGDRGCGMSSNFNTHANHYIKPNHITYMDLGAQAVHGLTKEYLAENGIYRSTALKAFLSAVSASDVLVAHNISFDMPIKP